MHRYYNEQYQINGGKQNRYVTGSDAAGLSMGHYDTKQLPIFKYLHSSRRPEIRDRRQLLPGGVRRLVPQPPMARCRRHAGVRGRPQRCQLGTTCTRWSTPTACRLSTALYTSPLGPAAKDASLTASCNPPAGRPATSPASCGDYAVNTTQPLYRPFSPGTADARRLPPLTTPTIGDRLSAKNVDWAWYAGGWSNATGNVGGPGWTNGSSSCTDPNANNQWPLGCPDKNFQYHHQPFNYFSNYQPGTAARTAHLKDEAEFIQAAQNGTLKTVSFIKPIGEENEHPGYASVRTGRQQPPGRPDARRVMNGPNGDNTLIIVTYDEFGGQWDHVPPPPHGRHGVNATPPTRWGPGTRIPALLVSQRFAPLRRRPRGLRHDVDHQDARGPVQAHPVLTRPVRNLAQTLKVTEP